MPRSPSGRGAAAPCSCSRGVRDGASGGRLPRSGQVFSSLHRGPAETVANRFFGKDSPPRTAGTRSQPSYLLHPTAQTLVANPAYSLAGAHNLPALSFPLPHNFPLVPSPGRCCSHQQRYALEPHRIAVVATVNGNLAAAGIQILPPIPDSLTLQL